MTSPSRPLLVWDGECSFCRRWIERWRGLTGDRVEYATYQDVAARFPEIPREKFAEAVRLIEPDGRVSGGAEAVFRTLSFARGRGWLIALYRRMPLFAPISEWIYRNVARRRPFFDRATSVIWGPHLVPPGERLTTAIFLRVLGLIFACAFVSLWVQVIGLVGHDGILPAADYLHAVAAQVGAIRFWGIPTVLWLGSSDGALHTVCAIGTAASLALALGLAPLLSLIVAWVCYLSLCSVCRDFLWFQWDSLLLETGFLAFFVAPWVWRSRGRADPAPPRAALWLLRWLLFRLMISSAACKLGSGDPTWRNLTALDYHYWSQPLPNWISWYANLAPHAFQKFSVLVMFACEGLAPFLIVAPRRVRFAGAAAMAGLQVMIFVTGNYGIFNLLALALLIPLLDDGVWPWRWERFRRTRAATAPVPAAGSATAAPDSAAPRASAPRWPAWLIRPIAAALIFLGLVPLFHTLRWPDRWLGPAPIAYRLLSPFRIVDPYGLFAVMTTQRLEIVIEGSMDGASWEPYEFRWKPGNVLRRPEFVTPHMPRLDWQMWFAALGTPRDNPWLLAVCERLLQGSKPVRALLGADPFHGVPPRFIRAEIFDYRFTDFATRRATSAWWRREPRGSYLPPLTLREGRLSLANPVESPP